MKPSRKQTEEAFAERLRIILYRATTWGEKEALAGITEADAKAELRRLIEERLRAGVIQ